MRLLLDTHALVWVLLGDRRLGPAARALVAEGAEEVFVSAVSLWEIALKHPRGGMPISALAAAEAVTRSGYRHLPLEAEQVLLLADLPVRADHRDPFDRMLVAQARHEGLTLMTADPKLAGYGVPLIGCD